MYSTGASSTNSFAPAYRFDAVTDISAPDPATVVIRVKQPTPNLLVDIGGFKGIAIVQRKNVESGTVATHPIGTGRFVFKSATSGDSVSLVANKNYPGAAPVVLGVTFRFIP